MQQSALNVRFTDVPERLAIDYNGEISENSCSSTSSGSSDSQQLTHIRTEETCQLHDEYWDVEFIYKDLPYTNNEKSNMDKIQNIQILKPERQPLSDRTNLNSSGNGQTLSRGSKKLLEDGNRFSKTYKPRLLDEVFESPVRQNKEVDQQPQATESGTLSDVTMQSTISIQNDATMQSVNTSMCSVISRVTSSGIRRTKSETVESVQRKRSSVSSIESEEKPKRKKSSDGDFGPIDDSSFDDVFLSEVSPDISHFSCYAKSSLNRTERPDSNHILRVSSCSVLEMGEVHSPHMLPQLLEVSYSLPVVEMPQKESQAFKSISAETLAEKMKLDGEDFSQRFVLIDCRYPYEYQGGHIASAINVHDQSRLEALFFDAESELRQRIPIFYCEFSQKRGPSMAHALRALDRRRNELKYPEVDYKEMYLLDRGYKKFFETHEFKELCEPSAYVAMVDERHLEQLRSFRMHRAKSTACVSRVGIARESRTRAQRLFAETNASIIETSTTEFLSEDFRASSNGTPQTSRSISLFDLSNVTCHEVMTSTPVITPGVKPFAPLDFDTSD